MMTTMIWMPNFWKNLNKRLKRTTTDGNRKSHPNVQEAIRPAQMTTITAAESARLRPDAGVLHHPVTTTSVTGEGPNLLLTEEGDEVPAAKEENPPVDLQKDVTGEMTGVRTGVMTGEMTGTVIDMTTDETTGDTTGKIMTIEAIAVTKPPKSPRRSTKNESENCEK